ncbi:MAG: flavin reductase family protein [Candidatus Pacearchaeota archaeon]|nr:flavin reductase family protein [Candidatus Pacearchaeota archaeon]
MKISEQLWPRIVVLITSTNKEGKENVMTVSFVMPISFLPKYVGLAIAPSRVTLKNIKETKEFCLNICSEEMLEAAKICGSVSGNEKDKFIAAGLTKEKASKIKCPIIKESPISFECKVELIKKFGDHYLVIGKVLREVIRKDSFRPLLHKTREIFPSLK